ncbi:hemolysin family protein [Nocardioides sp. cx-173]|uniref:hemolysin family protein n=1 Tax=Nocardioides sp. cx-173 TaxID=2898796 RepID=UPI001E4AC40E|nr:hemolysin family protein [Nocardioides sp. cx-173]MCD4525147.1 hemolysin family protein [Nocardioides sp. cx-173]UGB40151.1 hemolysin family protein [Nocardioides sp. cx-173]
MSEWLLLSIGLLLTVGTGLFVASEFALVNLDRHDLETRAGRGEKGLGTTIGALRITSTHLSSAQLGITLTTLLTGYTFEPAVSSLLEEPLTSAGLPTSAVPVVGAVVGVVLATLFSMVIGELVPKNFALAVPLATAKVVVPFQVAFTTVFRPLVSLLNNTANGLIRAMGVEPKEELSGARSADELTYLIRHSATAGLLEQDEATLLDRTLRFSQYDASDLMTPRVRMTSVDRLDSAARIIQVSGRTGFSRLPVLDDGPDDIVGFVHVKRAFAVPLDQRSTTTAEDLMFEPTRVPETLGAGALLAELRDRGLQIAVVTDEHGGTAGIVTLEDLVEEIVGELEDEHDRAKSGVTLRGRSVSFDASWRPDELLDRTGVRVPDSEDWDTVAGFVVDELERLPELGDEVAIESGTLRVERLDGARIVRIAFLPSADHAMSLTEDRR